MRLDQCQFFYWDPKIDPREPEYVGDPTGSLFLWLTYGRQSGKI